MSNTVSSDQDILFINKDSIAQIENKHVIIQKWLLIDLTAINQENKIWAKKKAQHSKQFTHFTVFKITLEGKYC